MGAIYLKSARSLSQFETVKSNQLILSIDGSWDEYIQSKEYLSKKEADKSSYFVDNMVKDYILN